MQVAGPAGAVLFLQSCGHKHRVEVDRTPAATVKRKITLARLACMGWRASRRTLDSCEVLSVAATLTGGRIRALAALLLAVSIVRLL